MNKAPRQEPQNHPNARRVGAEDAERLAKANVVLQVNQAFGYDIGSTEKAALRQAVYDLFEIGVKAEVATVGDARDAPLEG